MQRKLIQGTWLVTIRLDLDVKCLRMLQLSLSVVCFLALSDTHIYNLDGF